MVEPVAGCASAGERPSHSNAEVVRTTYGLRSVVYAPSVLGRLSLEVAAARAVGRVSRLAGRGGGTTLPGKLLWKADPQAIDSLAARLPAGCAVVSATNGKTTTAAMAAEILAPRFRLAHNAAGANLVSGVASA